MFQTFFGISTIRGGQMCLLRVTEVLAHSPLEAVDANEHQHPTRKKMGQKNGDKKMGQPHIFVFFSAFY